MRLILLSLSTHILRCVCIVLLVLAGVVAVGVQGLGPQQRRVVAEVGEEGSQVLTAHLHRKID